jgi:Regulator of ribonuclease activity B
MVIEYQKLEDMFSQIRGNTKWNIDGPMLWGYFFFDRSAEKLELAATHLTAQGYTLVGIHETDDGSSRVLHVERIEAHSPQTLFARNNVLDELATQLGLDCYDGMDVGPAPIADGH